MKKLLILFLSLQVFSAIAQDYQNIATPGLTYFSNGHPELLGYKYDSVTLNGTDSIYYAPPLIRRTSYYACSDTTGVPVLSRIIVRKPDGIFNFLNISGDTILFLSQANLNQIWTCCSLPAGRHVEAQVTDIRTDTIIDTTDLVKEITFMARNQDGTVFSHPVNGIKILLSKNFGFFKTLNWGYFPDSTEMWTLKGKTYPEIGIQNFDYKHCYDFEPGDEFHYLFSQFSGQVYSHIIERILQKTPAGGDTIIYSKEICWIKWYPTPPPNTQSYHDTINVVITGTGGDIFTSIPEQFKPFYYNGAWHADRYYKPEETFNGRQQKNYSWWLFCHRDSCWGEYCGGVDNWGITNEYYAKGLGQTGWYNEWWDGSYHEVNRRDLVYYKKGNEEWGTPYAPDCDVLLATKEMTAPSPSITIFPNPVDQGNPIYVKETIPGCTATVYDLSGKIICKTEVSENRPLLIENFLAKGSYILVIADKNGQCKGRTKVLVK